MNSTVGHVAALQQQLTTAGLPVEKRLAEELAMMASAPFHKTYSHSESSSPLNFPLQETLSSDVLKDAVLPDDMFSSSSPDMPAICTVSSSASHSQLLCSGILGGGERSSQSPDNQSPSPSGFRMDGTRLACVVIVLALPVMHMTGISLGGALHRGGSDMRAAGDYARLHSGGRVLASTTAHVGDIWTMWWPMIYFIAQVSQGKL